MTTFSDDTSVDLTAAEDLIDLFEVQPSSHPRSDAEREELLRVPPHFGTVFTDHMVRMSWTERDGWLGRRVVEYGPLQLDPATAVLHYGQEVFEGLKAYRHADGSVWTFRPEENAARFANSAHRLALPALSVDDFVGSLTALARVDAAWVPSDPEASLYLRPFMYASEPFLGVRPAREVEYLLIASPSGPYFAGGGVQPVSIWVDQEYSRAGRGGTGSAKCGGNYASSLLPQVEAAKEGCEQVCFVDASTGLYLEELGGMNMFVVYADGRIETPELSGSILPGVTRSSLIRLVADRGREVVERQIPLEEMLAGLADGSIVEVFACGTAAVITPIGRLRGAGFDHTVGTGEPGQLTMDLRAELTGIHTGRVADRHGWMYRLA